MKNLNTDHLARCIETLKSSLLHLQAAEKDSIEYEVFRNAVVKGFELVLEVSGKLLRKAIKAYSGSPRSVDELTYKDVLRHATKHNLLGDEDVKRWFVYRDNRNETAHDYGIEFSEQTLSLLPQFLVDARALQHVLQEKLGSNSA
jgi:nucleotidyltransferase substrate binding protein (TIGR01987 family)